MTRVHAFLTRSLRGQRDEFFSVGLTRGQQCGHNSPSFRSELITVATADSFDDSVRPQARQSAGDSAALPTLLSRLGLSGIKPRPDVTIAEPADHPLAPVDDFKQRCVRLRPRVKPAIAPPIALDWPAYRSCQLSGTLSAPHAGQCLKVTTVNRFANLRPPVKVSYAPAQDPANVFCLRGPVRWPDRPETGAAG
jgi:hypothetical protein